MVRCDSVELAAMNLSMACFDVNLRPPILIDSSTTPPVPLSTHRQRVGLDGSMGNSRRASLMESNNSFDMSIMAFLGNTVRWSLPTSAEAFMPTI